MVDLCNSVTFHLFIRSGQYIPSNKSITLPSHYIIALSGRGRTISSFYILGMPQMTFLLHGDLLRLPPLKNDPKFAEASATSFVSSKASGRFWLFLLFPNSFILSIRTALYGSKASLPSTLN